MRRSVIYLEKVKALTVKICAHNNGAYAVLDDEDADLLDFNWSDSGNWVNGTLGSLRRVIASRKYKRQLTSNDVVRHRNLDKRDFTRANLECMTRSEHSTFVRQKRYARTYPQLAYAITYLRASDCWRVEIDGSIHASESDAVTHYKRVAA